MKKIITLSLTASSILAALVPIQASAHGWADFPKARQVICQEDGGHWGAADGSQIPNEACRASFQESGTYPVVQVNEFATLVKDYTNMDAVKAAVKDGLICSGGDERKSGMSVASQYWQRTEMQAGATFTLKYRATAPHNPSHWQVYLTKPGYSAAHSRLGWDDLELIQEFGNIEKVNVDGGNYYFMNITLPKGRSGEATLVTRWQRDDPAGEGFYNCSDIQFDGDAPPSEWSAIGPFVKPGVIAEEGDIVWFRIFSSQGNEALVSEKLPITAANRDVNAWSYELAQQVNQEHSAIAQVGIEQSSGDIVYSQGDLYANQVFVTNPNYSYAVDVRDGDVIEPAPVVVKSLQDEYTQNEEGLAYINATVESEGRYLINMKLLDSTGHQLALASDIVDDGQIALSLFTSQTGGFTVEVYAAEQDAGHKLVETKSIVIKEQSGGGDFDYVYPDGLGQYVPGETVVKGRDGNIYQCRPFPEGGWCNINSAIHYEPGVGSAWQDAWIRQ